jgi:putative FmdB family regulatory protein
MKPSDYQCNSCSHIFELFIPDFDSFPETSICPRCNSEARRKFSPLPGICHQGRCGNQKNGYTSNLGYVKKT